MLTSSMQKNLMRKSSMRKSSMRKRKRRNERERRLLALTCGILLLAYLASAQIYLPPHAPEPSEYGKVILNHYSATEPGAVVFDHWLHRSKFTCRVCHVDIGFAMKAGLTDIKASDNIAGYYCGTCHNGKMFSEGQTVFASCAK